MDQPYAPVPVLENELLKELRTGGLRITESWQKFVTKFACPSHRWLRYAAVGVRLLERAVEQNRQGGPAVGVAQGVVDDRPDLACEAARLELLAPVSLNVVCFRYALPEMAEPELEALNREILLRLQEGGVAVPSSTWREGRFALRVAITNHRTRRADVDVLVEAVLALGAPETALSARLSAHLR